MPSATEGAGQTQLNAGLEAGIDTLSLNQQITFTKYVKQILPLDGYVFWIRSDLLSNAALKAAGLTRSDATLKVKGSLHYATDNQQREDETFGLNRVVFTAEAPVDDFNDIAPNVMYLAIFEGVRFSFTRRRSFYRQAAIYHYEGDAVYPALATQIVDVAGDINLDSLIVSNSLPIWLSLNKLFPIYPSFLVGDNIVPPYAACHIGETDTSAIQSAPSFDRHLSHYQLVKDRVRITFYGLTNQVALDWQDYVFSYMVNTDNMGLMNMPVMRDAKRTQSEMNVIAMKKTMEFEVSYYQSRINDLARQLILSAIPTILINPL